MLISVSASEHCLSGSVRLGRGRGLVEKANVSLQNHGSSGRCVSVRACFLLHLTLMCPQSRSVSLLGWRPGGAEWPRGQRGMDAMGIFGWGTRSKTSP